MADEVNHIEIGYVPDDGDEVNGGDPANHLDPDKAHGINHKKSHAKKMHQELEKLHKDHQSLIAENADLKDKYLRTLADFDNFRKRMRKEKEEFQQYHLSEFLSEMLLIVDNLERALKSRSEDSQNHSILSGVEMIFKMLIDLLKRFGVEELIADQQPFNPTIHQALSKAEDSTVSEPLVTEVYQKGFIYNGKLLRPALVRVSLPKESVADTVNEKD